MNYPTNRLVHIIVAFVKPVVEHWLEQEIAQWVHPEGHNKTVCTWSKMQPHGRASTHGARDGRKEMFYLTTHSTHFIYGYMASDI